MERNEPTTHCQPMKEEVRGLVVVLATLCTWENAKGWPCWSAWTFINSAVPHLSHWTAFFNKPFAMTVLWGAAEEPTFGVLLRNPPLGCCSGTHRCGSDVRYVPQVHVLDT